MIRMIFLNDQLQSFLEVTLQGAADTAAVDLGDLNAGFLKETAVNTDLTKFIFNQYYIFTCKNIFDQFLDQRCLTSAEESGNDINLCHKSTFFRALSL